MSNGIFPLKDGAASSSMLKDRTETLRNLQERLGNEVVEAFNLAGNEYGWRRYENWERVLGKFLDECFPGEKNKFKEDTKSLVMTAGFNDSKAQVFWKNKGASAFYYIESLINDIENDEYAKPEEVEMCENEESGDFVFIDRLRIDQLNEISKGAFDPSRITQFCIEIEKAYSGQCYLAVAALTRALLDHVPPIFGCKTFAEVANNYSGSKSFKSSMQHLQNSARSIGDSHLHSQIREKEALPTATQVNFSNDLDVLLSEVIRVLS